MRVPATGLGEVDRVPVLWDVLNPERTWRRGGVGAARAPSWRRYATSASVFGADRRHQAAVPARQLKAKTELAG